MISIKIVWRRNVTEEVECDHDYNHGPSPQPLPQGGGAIHNKDMQSEMLYQQSQFEKKENGNILKYITIK